VAVSWSGYFQDFLAGFGRHLPAWMCTTINQAMSTPGLLAHAPHLAGIPIVFNFPAFAIVALITALLVVGIKESARVNSVMVVLKVALVIGFTIVGAYWVKPGNWHPFAPHGFHGILTGASIIFFAYIGFDAISTTAEEAKNPQRDLPIGMIASLVSCTVLYVAVTAVLTGNVPASALG